MKTSDYSSPPAPLPIPLRLTIELETKKPQRPVFIVARNIIEFAIFTLKQ